MHAFEREKLTQILKAIQLALSVENFTDTDMNLLLMYLENRIQMIKGKK